MIARRGLYQLGGDANAVAGPAKTTFDCVTDSEFPRHLSYIDTLASILKGRIACDHEQRPEARQLGNNVFCDAVAEILLFRIPTHVGEWQHGDRRLFCCCFWRSDCHERCAHNMVDTNRLDDVLQG